MLNVRTVGGIHYNRYSENTINAENVKYTIKNLVLERDMFYKTYANGKSNKIPNKYKKELLSLAHTVMPAMNGLNTKETLKMFELINQQSDKQLLDSISKMFLIHEPLLFAIKHLFFKWKDYLERLIRYYMEIHGQNYNKKEKQYIQLLKEKKIHSSSPFLYFNFTERKYAIKWDKDADDFLNKSKDFKYIGFCSKIPIKRLKLLLQFPEYELRKIIMKKSPNKIKNDYKILHKELDFLISKCDGVKPTIKIKRKKPKNIQQYIDYFIDIYEYMQPYLLQKEKKIISIANQINDVADLL